MDHVSGGRTLSESEHKQLLHYIIAIRKRAAYLSRLLYLHKCYTRAEFVLRSRLSPERRRNSQIFMKLESLFLCWQDLLLFPALRQVNSIHALIFCFQRSILILYSHLRLGLTSNLFPSDFWPEFYIHFSRPGDRLFWMRVFVFLQTALASTGIVH